MNKFLPQSIYGRTFLFITILESLFDIILESIVIARLKLVHTLKISITTQDTNSTTIRAPLPVYLGIFILAHLFQLYFALDALRHKNTIQLIGLCGFNLAFLVYAGIQVPEIREIESLQSITNTDASTPTIILLIIPVCISISQAAFIYLTWHLFKEFVFMCLLKFDYFFFMAFSVQLVLLVPSVSPLERVLTIIALPTTLLLLLIGYYGVRREIKSVTFLFMLGLLSGSSYFIYKLFRIWQGRLDPRSYQNVFKSLTVFFDRNSSKQQKAWRAGVSRMGGVNSEGRHGYESREYGTGKAGEGVGVSMEEQSMSTFKSSTATVSKEDDDPVDEYFPASLHFSAHSPPPPFSLHPPPPTLSHSSDRPRLPIISNTSLSHLRRQNLLVPSPALDDSHKRMSID
ncbi:hypothetical protein VP01_1253g6 [Puccinia sorghi]|uniref:Uncharacterized protein n=1 Tax=Puccinia sorghi TaxID=27349 RepID=A0A0L6VPD9_9BASI|nr:hypothetical protein VP01_1253g6 [Puccinia sorghi]